MVEALPSTRRLESEGSMEYPGGFVGVAATKYGLGFVDIGNCERDVGQYDDPPIVRFLACGAARLIRRTNGYCARPILR